MEDRPYEALPRKNDNHPRALEAARKLGYPEERKRHAQLGARWT